MNRPIIKSLGPPPEMYADRIVAEMMRYIVAAQTKRWKDIEAIITEVTLRRSDGNPGGQAKLAKRIKKAGQAFIFDVFLEPGKRGKYVLHILDVSGFDPADKSCIMNVTDIPEKPWLSCNATKIHSKGRSLYDDKGLAFLFITHHSMSRLAQRCGAKEPRDLLDAVHSIWSAYLDIYDFHKTKVPNDLRLRFTLKGSDHAYAVLAHHEDGCGGMVVATILPPDAF
jgi:hypothetical protein